MDHFAGLDVSVKETSVCIVDDTGGIVDTGDSVPLVGNAARAADDTPVAGLYQYFR